MPVSLGGAQPIFLAPNIVARHRDDVLSFRELDLEYHQGLFAERHFRAGEIKFLHPHELPVVNELDVGAVGEEAFAPLFQGLSIVQA
jgi:hypothetical protein